jgi:mRNA interferase RelE/StbE
MSYRVSLKATAEKSLNKLPKAIQARVIEKATALGHDPRPPGSAKLAGPSGLWRVRIGDYRIVYMIDDEHQFVDVRIISHRRDVYRGM